MDAPSVDIAGLLSGLGLGHLQRVDRIKHGLTNQSWQASTGAGTFIVRLSTAAEATLQIDRRSEAAILEVVSRAGIGPEVVHCDPGNHVLVTRYAGPTWIAAQVRETQGIDEIATLLRRLHTLMPPQGARTVDLSAAVSGYLQTLDERGVRNEATVEALRQRARQVAGVLQAVSSARLCHNDVHALNLVGADPARLVDWEYAGLGEPMFDLAAPCVYHEFTRAQRERLLSTYLTSGDPTAWHRLELSCWLFEYIRDLWVAVREELAAKNDGRRNEKS